MGGQSKTGKQSMITICRNTCGNYYAMTPTPFQVILLEVISLLKKTENKK